MADQRSFGVWKIIKIWQINQRWIFLFECFLRLINLFPKKYDFPKDFRCSQLKRCRVFPLPQNSWAQLKAIFPFLVASNSSANPSSENYSWSWTFLIVISEHLLLTYSSIKRLKCKQQHYSHISAKFEGNRRTSDVKLESTGNRDVLK